MGTFNLIYYGEDIDSEYIQVYLHGKGGFRSLEGLYEYPDFPLLAKNGRLPLNHPFVIVHASNCELWDSDLISSALARIKVEHSGKIIHLVGYSRGGEGVYRYLNTGNDVELASVINSRTPENFYSKAMLQIIHTDSDHTESVDKVQKFSRALAKTNKGVTFETFKGDHFSIGEIALSGIVDQAINNHRQWTRK